MELLAIGRAGTIGMVAYSGREPGPAMSLGPLGPPAVTMPPELTGNAMKKRSRAGGVPIKARRPKTPKPKRGNAPKIEARSKPSPEVARLARERDEAVDQQAATSEVLSVISASPGELELVFQAMLERAVRLCEAKFGNIYRWDGEARLLSSRLLGARPIVLIRILPSAVWWLTGR